MSGSDDLIPDSAIGTSQSNSSGSSDLIPDSSISEWSPKKAPDWLIDSDKPLEQGATPLSYGAGAANTWAGGKLASGAKWLGVKDPQALKEISNIPAAAEMVLPFSFTKGGTAVAETSEADHPLASAATAENSRLGALDSQAKAQGFDLDASDSDTAAMNRSIANHGARQDLGLPRNAALTPEMLKQARQTYVSPAYEAVKELPDPIPLSPDTKATLQDVAPLTGTRINLPTGDDITGQEAVNLSKTLRSRANQLDGLQGVNASGDLWSDVAKAHKDAAVSIENDVRDHLADTDRESLADDWDAARIYRAKSGSYESALDGAGNVDVTKLKRQQMNGVPLSDNADLLAYLGARYPRAFKPTIGMAPKPGLGRQFAAGVTRLAGTAGGAALGGPIGAIAGEAVSDKISNKLLGR